MNASFARKSIIKFLLPGILSCSYMISSAHAEIDYVKLFATKNPLEPVPNALLVAQYFSEDKIFILVSSERSENLTMVEKGQIFYIDGTKYVFANYTEKTAILKDEANKFWEISFDKQRSSMSPKPVDPALPEKKNLSPLSSLSPTGSEYDLAYFRSLAKNLGIPALVTNQFKKLPSQSRSGGGRPGWKLDETVPSLLLATSPFELNDIILSIDGIAVNRIESLAQHLEKRKDGNKFDVEIERRGKLIMINLKL